MSMKALKGKIIFLCALIAFTVLPSVYRTIHAEDIPEPETNEIIFYYDQNAPTPSPTVTPKPTPTIRPTATPTVEPTTRPTAEPTAVPTTEPTAEPTTIPTAEPTAAPTAEPTAIPTAAPTAVPTAAPTAEPTAIPTAVPTAFPTAGPATVPSEAPLAESTGESSPGTVETVQTPESLDPDAIPENAVLKTENGITYVIIPDEDNENLLYIYDEMGTPLGYIYIDPGMDFDSIDIEKNLIPFGTPENLHPGDLQSVGTQAGGELKVNPQTGDRHTSGVYVVAMILFCIVSFLFAAEKSE